VSAASRQEQKGSAFRAMHAGDPFLIPNPWDAGSARVLQALGFQALATTSSGYAFTLGLRDGRVTLEQMADHVAAVDAATDLPVSADLENGYGAEPADAAAAIHGIAAAGAVGGSIEDFDRERHDLYGIDLAVERIRAAAEAARAVGFPFTLTARAENHIRGNPDLADTIRRLQAYDEAGADVLYAPGLATVEEIRTVCDAVSKPVNVLALPNLSVRGILEAGAQRISVGGGLTWVAVQAFADAATAIRDRGDLSALAARVPLDDWFGG
jgi:2-methylisocitrate lyase-like PEP mutase family enzyme